MTALDRRTFLQTGLLGSALLFAGRTSAATEASTASFGTQRRARNVIVLVSDGMSLGTLTLAELFRTRFEGRSTHWVDLYRRPDLRRALMETSSASSPVTDSAAAASAWGCGHKVNNGAINIDPCGKRHVPILPRARAAGLATGLVTTATITHATPAGFAAQATARAAEADIARQYLDGRIDVLLGGGSKFFDPATRDDKRDLAAAFVEGGYRLVRDRDGLLQTEAGAKPLLGLFSPSHMPFELDRRAEPSLAAGVPSLAEMAGTALAHLAKAPQGFILQIEGARVDHAAHANDVGALIHDQLAFDDALGVVLDFVRERDDTLVVVTTDHANSNPGLNGVGGSFGSKGGSYGETWIRFDRIAKFQRTNAWIIEGLDEKSTPELVTSRVREATGIDLPADDAELLCRSLRKEHRDAYRVRNSPINTLGQLLSNHTSVGWTGTQHTADYVELLAFGPGSDRVGGFLPNTALFPVMANALGLALEA